MVEIKEDVCSVLREIVESIAMLFSVESKDLYVRDRLSFIQARVENHSGVVQQLCGDEVYGLYIDLMNSSFRDEVLLNKFMLALHECMVKNGCVSNVSLIE